MAHDVGSGQGGVCESVSVCAAGNLENICSGKSHSSSPGASYPRHLTAGGHLDGHTEPLRSGFLVHWVRKVEGCCCHDGIPFLAGKTYALNFCILNSAGFCDDASFGHYLPWPGLAPAGNNLSCIRLIFLKSSHLKVCLLSPWDSL